MLSARVAAKRRRVWSRSGVGADVERSETQYRGADESKSRRHTGTAHGVINRDMTDRGKPGILG